MGYPKTSFLSWLILGYPGISRMSSYPGISQYKSGFGRVSLFQMGVGVLRTADQVERQLSEDSDTHNTQKPAEKAQINIKCFLHHCMWCYYSKLEPYWKSLDHFCLCSSTATQQSNSPFWLGWKVRDLNRRCWSISLQLVTITMREGKAASRQFNASVFTTVMCQFIGKVVCRDWESQLQLSWLEQTQKTRVAGQNNHYWVTVTPQRHHLHAIWWCKQIQQ